MLVAIGWIVLGLVVLGILYISLLFALFIGLFVVTAIGLEQAYCWYAGEDFSAGWVGAGIACGLLLCYMLVCAIVEKIKGD